MDDIVAVRVLTRRGDVDEAVYFLTWGCVFDPVDPSMLLEVVAAYALRGWANSVLVDADVCLTLSEASGLPYFFEGIARFACNLGPHGRFRHRRWRRRTAGRMLQGKEIYLIGRMATPAPTGWQ